MKKALLLTGLLLVLVVPAAMAAGVSLNWTTNCWGDTPQALQTFACASNTSPSNWRMTSSFKVDEAHADYINFDSFIEGVSEAGAIPDWWKFSVTTDCRGAIASVYTHAVPGGSCPDPFEGGASGGGGYVYATPTEVQIQAIYTVAAGVAIEADLEYYLSTFTFKNGKTVGTNLCAGCPLGMVFGLHHIDLGYEVSGQSVRLAEPYQGGNQCIVWQHDFPGQPCHPPVPTRNTTWGQVKSLYR